jgi:hypothetical protein
VCQPRDPPRAGPPCELDPASESHTRVGASSTKPSRFRGGSIGNSDGMVGAALALVVIGVVFLFVIPWVGIAVGIVGVALFIAFLAGFGRRAAQSER